MRRLVESSSRRWKYRRPILEQRYPDVDWDKWLREPGHLHHFEPPAWLYFAGDVPNTTPAAKSALTKLYNFTEIETVDEIRAWPDERLLAVYGMGPTYLSALKAWLDMLPAAPGLAETLCQRIDEVFG